MGDCTGKRKCQKRDERSDVNSVISGRLGSSRHPWTAWVNPVRRKPGVGHEFSPTQTRALDEELKETWASGQPVTLF